MGETEKNLRIGRINEWLHIYFPIWFAVATILDLVLLTYIAYHR